MLTMPTWTPLLLQVVLILMTIGVMWGSLAGDLKLIRYRLDQIERKVGIPVIADADKEHH